MYQLYLLNSRTDGVQRRNQGGGAHWAFAPPVSFEGALEANAAPAHEKDLQAPKAPATPFRM